MALRFSFFDRVLGISPQVVGYRLLRSPDWANITPSQDWFPLCRQVSGVPRWALRCSWAFRLL